HNCRPAEGKKVSQSYSYAIEIPFSVSYQERERIVAKVGKRISINNFSEIKIVFGIKKACNC
ncbi:MAG: hypothetical protein K2O54_01815, partial [Prevotella sp.]|nr:hypothetical protein [Prevotella sp.]